MLAKNLRAIVRQVRGKSVPARDLSPLGVLRELELRAIDFSTWVVGGALGYNAWEFTKLAEYALAAYKDMESHLAVQREMEAREKAAMRDVRKFFGDAARWILD